MSSRNRAPLVGTAHGSPSKSEVEQHLPRGACAIIEHLSQTWPIGQITHKRRAYASHIHDRNTNDE